MAAFEIKRGDIFIVNFNTTQGFEIRGVRPALVIQNDVGNHFSNTIIVAAMTRTIKRGEKIFVRVRASETGLNSDGTVLLDQIYTISRDRFQNPPIGRLITAKMAEVDQAIKNSLGL
jgi:mRNA interferase MazF